MKISRKSSRVIVLLLGLACLPCETKQASGGAKVSKRTAPPKAVSHAEKRKLVRDVSEAMKDPQEKELEKIDHEAQSKKTGEPTAQALETSRPVKARYVPENKWKWIANWLAVGAGVAYDSDGGVWGTTHVNWTPTLIFNDSFRFKVSLGVSGLNLFTTGTFVGLDGFAGFVFSGARPWLLDVGGGAQYWSNKEGFLPQIRGAIGYRFRGDGDLFHAIQFSYSRLFNELLNINMVVASLALRF